MTSERLSARKLGSDRVLARGRRTMIDAAAEMAPWEPRKYRRPAVLFEGTRYFVVAKEPGAGSRVRYLLEPWPADSPEDPAFEIHYDEEYVAARDASLRRAAAGRGIEPIVLAVTPLIGLLSADLKVRLERDYGIHSRVATGRSLWLEYFIFLLASVLLAISTWTGGMTGFVIVRPRVLVPVLVVVGLDCVVRYSSLKEGMEKPWGFYEWLIRAKLRRR